MNIKDISVPEVYKESADFRFFIEWFKTALTKIQYDTENFFDLYDPLRCPEHLLWMLSDTMGYTLDDRLPTAFNRLVLLYFMSMIYNRGSRDGIVLAAQTNLAQFSILQNGRDNEVLYNRLEDTSIPVNSVYVTTHPADGYIDVVYFSTKTPIDACIEYVRPLGMFLFQHAGVRMDSRTKISVDARLTDERDIGMSYGPTHVGHYRREDYARLQKTSGVVDHIRNDVWYRNSKYEDIANGDGSYGSGTDSRINPGYRALYSLQICNNEHIVKALIDPIFSLGYGPQSELDTYDAPNVDSYEYDVAQPTNYLRPPYQDVPAWNLRYDKDLDEAVTATTEDGHYEVETVDSDRSTDILNPRPAVNPIMSKLGDAISLTSPENTIYTEVDKNDNISTKEY